jgi:cation diffusion facilitator family transporter
VSVGALALTAVVQLAVVLVSGSVALLSDTIHNFADALTAVPLGVAFWVGRRPPNRRYNYGYGRAEDLAGIAIVAIIAASSVLAALEALSRLRHPQHVSALPWVVAAGVIGFAGNEAVAMYRIRVGNRIGSAALVADGHHARTDGLTSLAVVAGALAVAAGWQRDDPAVGLLITVAILFVLKNAAREIYRRLMDAVDPDLVEQAEGLLSDVPGVLAVDAVRLRWVGHELHGEADIACDPDLTIAGGHEIAERALHRLLHELPRLSQATIHTNPMDRNGPMDRDGMDAHHVTAHHYPPAVPPGAGD